MSKCRECGSGEVSYCFPAGWCMVDKGLRTTNVMKLPVFVPETGTGECVALCENCEPEFLANFGDRWDFPRHAEA